MAYNQLLYAKENVIYAVADDDCVGSISAAPSSPVFVPPREEGRGGRAWAHFPE